MRTTVWHEQSKLTNSYSVRWYNPESGKKERAFCATFRDVQKKKAEIKTWLLNRRGGKGEPDGNVSETFEKYIMWLQRNNRRDGTIQIKRASFESIKARMTQIKDFTAENIEAWHKSLEEKGYSQTTINIRLRDCRAFLNWCIEQKIITEHAFNVRMAVPHTPRRKIPDSELALLESKMDERFKPYLYLLIDHGVRRGEALAVTWADLDLDKKLWHIPEEHTKTHRAHTIPLSDRAVASLNGLPRVAARVFDGWCKTTPRWYLNKAKKAAEKELGIILGPVHPHLFRHTRASNWRGNVYALMDYMGWKSIAMAKLYSHFSPDDLREEAAK